MSRAKKATTFLMTSTARAAVFVILFSTVLGHGAVYAKESLGQDEIEQDGRTIDAVALNAKRKSIIALTQLVKKRRNTRDEAAVLLRLAETIQTVASIQYRIAHGKAI